MKIYLMPFVCFLLLICIVSCSSNSSNQFKSKSGAVLHAAESNNDTIISSYKYYLENSLNEIKKQSWRRVVVDTVNDEFNRWLEAKFYYLDNEWIKIEVESENKVSVSSIETNTNYFLKDSPIKIGDEISSWILKDSAQFDFDEGKMSVSIGRYKIKARCIDDISDFEYDRILEAREVQKKELLPEKIQTCKVSLVRVLK